MTTWRSNMGQSCSFQDNLEVWVLKIFISKVEHSFVLECFQIQLFGEGIWGIKCIFQNNIGVWGLKMFNLEK